MTTREATRFLRLAEKAAEHSHCRRRHVGALLIREREDGLKVILRKGINRAPREGCDACPREGFPSGDRLDLCPAEHAEIGALKNRKEIRTLVRDGERLVLCVTTHPCADCCRKIEERGIMVVFYLENYPGQEEAEKLAPHVRFVKVGD